MKKYIFSAISGDATASNSGALTIANGSVENAMLGFNCKCKLANDGITIGSDDTSLGDTITDLNGLTSLDVDNITIDGNTISSTNTNGNIILDPNGTGVINVSSARITSLATPTGSTDAATKHMLMHSYKV